MTISAEIRRGLDGQDGQDGQDAGMEDQEQTKGTGENVPFICIRVSNPGWWGFLAVIDSRDVRGFEVEGYPDGWDGSATGGNS